jgi:hypothetical protein
VVEVEEEDQAKQQSCSYSVEEEVEEEVLKMMKFVRLKMVVVVEVADKKEFLMNL